MPELANLRHERFARFRAQGMLLEASYERAGYAPDRSHASRLARREDVCERIFELRLDHTDVRTAERPRVIEILMNIAADSQMARTPGGYEQSRIAALEAVRLQLEHEKAQARDRRRMSRDARKDGVAGSGAAGGAEAVRAAEPVAASPLRLA
jgi:hypothetical protein